MKIKLLLTLCLCTSFMSIITLHGENRYKAIYSGDCWSFPKQGSAATYVWQPISISGDEISIPVFRESWQIDKSLPGWSTVDIIRKSIML